MAIRKRRLLFISFLISAFLLPLFLSCGGTSGQTLQPGFIDIPARQQLSAGLVEEIRLLTETGVLPSMLAALELIRSRDLSGIEFGRMMTGINVLLIRLVYPDSPARLPAVDLPATNNYTRIIREAQNGSYVQPQASSDDFFEHILPFLAVNSRTSPEMLPAVLNDLQKAALMRPDSVLPHFFQGIVYESLNFLDEAEAAYRRAYNISNECYPALTGIARIARLRGNMQQAQSLFSDLMVRYPDSMEIKRELVLTMYDNRSWDTILPIIDEILLTEPRNGDFLLMKAHVQIEQGNFQQGNATLDVYALINTTDRFYLLLRARVQAEGNRNRDSALNYLRSILRANEEDIEALTFAARLLMESNRASDLQEGRGYLERLRLLNGSSIEVLSLSLQDAVRRESWQEAQGYLNGVLQIRRTAADLTYAYQIHRGLNNNAGALSYAQELFNLDSSNHDYAYYYISSLIDNRRPEEAARLLEPRINSSGGSIRARYYYLRSRTQSNEEAALSDLRSSIFEDPRNLDSLIAMFEIYHRRNDERRAVYYLRQALAIAPDNPLLRPYEIEYAPLLR